MIFTSNRWLLLVALLISGALWLAVSSVMANVVHVFAKQNFSWRSFGSVSIWLIAASFVCLMVSGYLLIANKKLPATSQAVALCAVATWVGLLLVLTALGDQWLGNLGIAGLIVWLIEIAVAVFLVANLCRQSPPFIDLQSQVLLIVITLVWLTAAKAAFLCLSPGVSIRI